MLAVEEDPALPSQHFSSSVSLASNRHSGAELQAARASCHGVQPQGCGFQSPGGHSSGSSGPCGGPEHRVTRNLALSPPSPVRQLILG
ncbi:hypothetical protein SRHO_G00080270 [Serrasalmus rhombeus]